MPRGADLDATQEYVANASGKDESGCPCDLGYYRRKIPAVIPMLAYDLIRCTREQPQDDKRDQINIIYLTDKRNYVRHQVQRYNGIDNRADEEGLVSGRNSTIFEKARKQLEKVRNSMIPLLRTPRTSLRSRSAAICHHLRHLHIQNSSHTNITPSEETLIK